jgi:dUTP pyrophosphatase
VVVQLERLPESEGLPLPGYQTEGSAGMDLLAAVDSPVELQPGEAKSIPTGIRIALPEGYEAQIRPRSGLALHHGVTLLNTPGTIDADYRGPLCVIMYNAGKRPFAVRRGDRIAQMVIAPVCRAELEVVPRLDDTARGEGGFGSTGISGQETGLGTAQPGEIRGERG